MSDILYPDLCIAPAVIAALIGAASAVIPKLISWFSGEGRFKSWADSVTGAHLSGAQNEANAFTADQAQKQMDFQQTMRDTQYQSAVADMRAAGVNPALMYGSGANGNSAMSGSMASSVAPGSASLDPVGLLGQIANLYLVNSQKRLIDSEVNKNVAETDLTKQNIVKAGAEIQNIKANVRKLGFESDAQEVVNKYLDRIQNVTLQNMTLEGDVLAANWTKIQQEISNLNTEQMKILQDITESKERVNLLLTQESLNEAQVNEVLASIRKINQETDNLIKTGKITQKEIDYYEWNHAADVNIAGYRPGTRQIPRDPHDSKINVNPFKKGSYKIVR